MSTHMIGSNHGDKKVFVMKVALFFEFTEVGILQLQCKGHVESLEPLQGAASAQKAFQGSARSTDEGVAGRNYRE